MHMAWMRTVCGRLKGDYRYSNTLVYNNFVFPEPTEKQKSEIEKRAQKILDVRNKYVDSTLAALYDPLSTPRDLLKAHQDLDKAVEKAYGKTFKTDEEREAFLFEKYQEKHNAE
ncbi:type IIL restriction-modification enzyme MmeI [Cytobacillus kochii]